MEDAYTIGIRLALDDGVSAGIAAIGGDLATLDRAVAATTGSLTRLGALAGAAPHAAAAEVRRFTRHAAQLAPAPTTEPPPAPARPRAAEPPPPAAMPVTAPSVSAPPPAPVTSALPAPTVQRAAAPPPPAAPPVFTPASAPPMALAPTPIAAPPPPPLPPAGFAPAAPPPPPPAPAAPSFDVQQNFVTNAPPPASAPTAPAAPTPAAPAAAATPFAFAAPPSPRLASMAPPPAAQAAGGPTHGDVFLDGMRVGRWMSDSLARDATRPPAGATAFDPRIGPSWPGTLQGG